MSNGDYGYFGKGDTGYAQYMTAFNRNFGGSSGGGGGGGNHNNNGGGGGNGSGNDELQRRRAVHFSTPGQKPPQAKQNARPVRRKIQQIGRIPRPENPSGELRSPPARDGFSPPVAHKFRRQPIAARVLHAVKAMEQRRFGKLSESGDMN